MEIIEENLYVHTGASRVNTLIQLTIIIISINLLAFYHEWRSVIGYATHYLFCDR